MRTATAAEQKHESFNGRSKCGHLLTADSHWPHVVVR